MAPAPRSHSRCPGPPRRMGRPGRGDGRQRFHPVFVREAWFAIGDAERTAVVYDPHEGLGLAITPLFRGVTWESTRSLRVDMRRLLLWGAVGAVACGQPAAREM